MQKSNDFILQALEGAISSTKATKKAKEVKTHDFILQALEGAISSTQATKKAKEVKTSNLFRLYHSVFLLMLTFLKNLAS